MGSIHTSGPILHDEITRACRIRKRGSLLFLLVLASPVGAKQKKAVGEIDDQEAFARVSTYCVDASELPSEEAYDVTGFAKTENKRGRLLSKLNWKLASDCGDAQPDARITLEFPRQHRVTLGNTDSSNPVDPAGQNRTDFNYRVTAVLRVFDADSRRLLYAVEAQPMSASPITDSAAEESPHVMRRDAMYGAFWTLISDIELVSRQSKP